MPDRDDRAAKRGQRAWSSRSLAGAWQHAFFYGCIRLFGLAPAKGALFFVVLFYSLRPSIAARAHAYLERRFGPSSSLMRRARVFKLYWSFAVILLERSAAGITGKYAVASRDGCDETLQGLLQEGKGLIVLSAHVGFWQLALAGLCRHATVNMLQPRGSGDIDRHFFEHAPSAGRYPIAVIDPGGAFGGFVDARAALGRGEIVCLMGDRMADGEKTGLAVDFLGKEALFPGSPYALAALTGAPLAVVFSRRTGTRALETFCPTVIRPPSQRRCSERCLLECAAAYAAALEAFARADPYQFFTFHTLWKR